MKRLLFLLLLAIPLLASAQTSTPTDTLSPTPKYLRTKGFHGMVDINYNYATPGPIGTYNGVGADAIFGYRFNQWYHLGGGVGFHSLLYSKQSDYNLFASLYLNNSFYIPTRCQVYPMFDLAIGLDFGFLGVGQNYYTPSFGLYARAGAGIETKHFNLCLGYEYIAVSSFYVKVGYNF